MPHLPGPWTVDPNGVLDANGKLLCLTRADLRGAANARLIAAAPDLLACCESEIALYEGMDADAFSTDARRKLAAMRAAVAKAKEGEPC